jgi:hypothetical protein
MASTVVMMGLYSFKGEGNVNVGSVVDVEFTCCNCFCAGSASICWAVRAQKLGQHS